MLRFLKVAFILMALCPISLLMAQKVVVQDAAISIDNVHRKGLSTTLLLDAENVEDLWKKQLKKFGSLKTKNGVFYVEQANIPSLTLSSVRIISKLESNDKGTTVWYSLDLGDAYVTAEGDKNQYQEAVKILHDFGVQAYLADINEQIKEAERVLSITVRDQEKVISKGESIQNSLGKNRAEKIRLEQKLVENGKDYQVLLSDSAQNFQNKISAAENVEKMKRAVDAVRAKATKVE